MFFIAAAVASLNNDFAGMMLFFLIWTPGVMRMIGKACQKVFKT